MKVVANKTNARLIRSALYHAKIKGYKVTYTEVDPTYYSRYVDIDDWKHEEDVVDSRLGYANYRVIRVDYPADYYALPRYITTADLAGVIRDMKKAGEELNVDNYKRRLVQLVEI